jgi:hypothetical protein
VCVVNVNFSDKVFKVMVKAGLGGAFNKLKNFIKCPMRPHERFFVKR